MNNKKKTLSEKYDNINKEDYIKNDIKYILKYYTDQINNIHDDVSKLQKRKSKYEVNDVFNVMVKSSFNDNCYSDFTNDYGDLKLASTGNLSYWCVKIYDVNFDDAFRSCYYLSNNNYDKNHANIELTNDKQSLNLNKIHANMELTNDKQSLNLNKIHVNIDLSNDINSLDLHQTNSSEIYSDSTHMSSNIQDINAQKSCILPINLNKYSYHISDPKDKKFAHIYNKYQEILSVDGTVIRCAINNPNGTNISSLTISSILNISNNLFYDYQIADDCDERKALLKQPLTKNQLIIMDRGYDGVNFLKKLDKN